MGLTSFNPLRLAIIFFGEDLSDDRGPHFIWDLGVFNDSMCATSPIEPNGFSANTRQQDLGQAKSYFDRTKSYFDRTKSYFDRTIVGTFFRVLKTRRISFSYSFN